MKNTLYNIPFFIYAIFIVSLYISFVRKPLDHFVVDFLFVVGVCSLTSWILININSNLVANYESLSKIPDNVDTVVYGSAVMMELRKVSSDATLSDNQLQIVGTKIIINHQLVSEIKVPDSILTALYNGVFYANIIHPSEEDPYVSGNVRVFVLENL